MNLPRRRWVVENRPAMFPSYPWKRSLGPYFRRKTAESYLKRMRSFVPSTIAALRVRDLSEPPR